MKKIAVLQSNYIPWKGYFDIIHQVDEFIFYDDVQYTKNDWRNRNIIQTNAGPKWITVPAGSKENLLIDEVVLKDHSWQKKHHKMLLQSYARAPFLSLYREFLDHVYLEKEWNSLSELNQYLIRSVSSEFLGIETRFTNSRDYHKAGTKLERLLNLLKSAGAEYYLSGPAAKDYIPNGAFEAAGIKLAWMDYSGYPAYRQLHSAEGCAHGVSILDLLFNTGPDAPWYIWGWRDSPQP